MGLIAYHRDVEQLQREAAALGSLVLPADKARAVAGGCAMKLLAVFLMMTGGALASALGLVVAEHVHWIAGAVVAVVGGLGSVFGSIAVANAGIAALYRRAIRRALSTPKLGAVSSGSSTAIPSMEPGRGHE